jgi:hypothetical protein
VVAVFNILKSILGTSVECASFCCETRYEFLVLLAFEFMLG